METTKAINFEAKREAAYETLQKLKNVNAPEADIRQANTMFRFWEAMEQEAGESLGALLYEFAVLVNFDTKLLKPIADKDAGFWSDIEGMGFLDFQLKRLELERSNRQISLLQSIDIGIKGLVNILESKLNMNLSPVEADLLLKGNALTARMKERLAEIEKKPSLKQKEELVESGGGLLTDKDIDDLFDD